MNVFSPTMGIQNPTFNHLGSGAQAQNPNQEMQLAFLLALAQLSSLLNSSNSAGSGLVSGASQFGGVSNGNSLGSFLGDSSSSSGSSALRRTSNSSSVGSQGGGSGQAAVDYARQFQGKDSSSIKGKMKHFTAAGGITNNCCDFVSAALEGQGLVKGHHVNVKSFEQQLKKQGYRQVPSSQARPGDVWISNSRGHTELVATKGATTRLIGSNNNGDSRQEITEHATRPGSGIIYQKG